MKPEGEAGLESRSSRRHTMPTKTALKVEQKVLAALAKHRDGPDVLGPKIGGWPPCPTRATQSVATFSPSSSTTTLFAATAPSTASLRSAACTNVLAGYS